MIIFKQTMIFLTEFIQIYLLETFGFLKNMSIILYPTYGIGMGFPVSCNIEALHEQVLYF